MPEVARRVGGVASEEEARVFSMVDARPRKMTSLLVDATPQRQIRLDRRMERWEVQLSS